MSVEQVASRLSFASRDYAIFDVREQWQYSTNHIAGAATVPLGDLERLVAQLVPEDAPILVYSGQDHRAHLAQSRLAALGYRRVFHLDGGFDAWIAAGGGCEHGWGTVGREYGEKIAQTRKVPAIRPEEVMQRRLAGAPITILDVRTADEYREKHLPGAYSTPLDRLPLEAADLLANLAPEATVVVNCAGRTRSIFGADLLQRMGIRQAVALENGTMAWGMCGYALEPGEDPRAGDRGPSSTSASQAERFAKQVAADVGVRPMSVRDLASVRDRHQLHYLIDVRQPAEYADGHIPGAVSCETCFVAIYAENLIGIPNAPIIMVCDGVARAALAAEMYRGLGYPDVYFLDGGTAAWQQAGGSVERGAAKFEVPGLASARKSVRALPLDAFRGLLAEPDTCLIDVRSIGWYAMGHIKEAKWLSRSYIDRCAPILLPNRDHSVAIVCDDDVRSSFAAAQLEQLGYRRVAILDGGLGTWRTAGLPLVEGLSGTGVSLADAKRDVMPLYMRGILARNENDMRAFLEDEEALGAKYTATAP